MLAKNLYQVVASLILVLLFCLISNVSKADQSGPYPGVFPAYVPNPQPAPAQVPPTPVPSVPTDAELYQVSLTRLFNLNGEINFVQGDLAFYQFLLNMSPGNPMIQGQVNALTMRLTMLQIEKQILIDYMKTLNP